MHCTTCSMELTGRCRAMNSSPWSGYIWKGARAPWLGIEATRAFSREKLKLPAMFDPERVQGALNDLTGGTGPTYFAMVLQVIAQHPNITLRGQGGDA